MAEYKIGEFRANIKKAFDEAARGESVCIDRYGEDFYLISKKDWNDTLNGYVKVFDPAPPATALNLGITPLGTLRPYNPEKNIDGSQSDQKD